MKITKHQHGEIANIISEMTDLEVSIARHSSIHSTISKETQKQWFQSLTKLTSRLNAVWKEI